MEIEMKTSTLLIAGLALVIAASPAEAQDRRWGVEARGGVAFPTQDIGADELGRGVALEGTLSYRFTPQVGAYAGWGWAHFNPETSFAGADIDFEKTGYVFGLEFEHALAQNGPVTGWLRVGGSVAHLELEDAGGDIVADSGHGLGFDASAGLAFALGDRWTLTPGVRYSLLSRDLEIGPVTTDVELEYVAVDIGLAFSF
jgi:opacity protein-like surface antigen